MDIICFSHLRWDFVYQRPQHLMSRFARSGRVFYIEEPVFHAAGDEMNIILREKVCVVTFHLQQEQTDDADERQRRMLQRLCKQFSLSNYICWFCTPMAFSLACDLAPRLIIYDCMDELSAFRFAPPVLKLQEALLFNAADLVFTGGNSLYEAKKEQHENIYAFPSSIDKAHFRAARTRHDPDDQAAIPYPRLGFYGVLDERFDIELVRTIAQKKPDWQLVLIGPVVKIDPADLPHEKNIHYLGARPYKELPAYLSGWDVAMIVFALNDSTRYISPTKTPEYLAGGKPVISTAISDVVNPYGVNGLVDIAYSAEEFIHKATASLLLKDKTAWLAKVDLFLADMSWEITVRDMKRHILDTLYRKHSEMPQEKEFAYA